MADTHPVAVGDGDWAQQIEQHDGLVMVDFWAEWCTPCRVVAPVMEQLAAQYDGKVRVAKLDVDANQRTAARFNVRSIPSVLFFRNGTQVDTVVGAYPKAYFVQKIEEHLQKIDQPQP